MFFGLLVVLCKSRLPLAKKCRLLSHLWSVQLVVCCVLGIWAGNRRLFVRTAFWGRLFQRWRWVLLPSDYLGVDLENIVCCLTEAETSFALSLKPPKCWWMGSTHHSFPGPLRSLCGSFVYRSAAHFAVLFGSSVENQGIQTWIPSVNLPIFMLPCLQCWGSLGWAGLSHCCCSSWCLRPAIPMNLCMDVLQTLLIWI